MAERAALMLHDLILFAKYYRRCIELAPRLGFLENARIAWSLVMQMRPY